MVGKKTSAEQTKEEQKDTQVGNLLDAAFGDLGGLQKADEEEVIETTGIGEEIIAEETPEEEVAEETQELQSTEAPLEEDETIEEEISTSPAGPPSGPPSGPPAGPPSGPPTESPVELVSQPPSNSPEVVEMVQEEMSEEPMPEDTPVEEEQIVLEDAQVESNTNFNSEEIQSALNEQQILAEQEIARLNAEVERLRQSMAGVADVIEELETPPMPPAVIEDIVIGAYIVSDFARLARQLDREQLIRATMGNIAMLHPDNLGIMIATRNRTMLPRLDERGLCAGLLGRPAPRGAPADWRIMEVVLASVSLVTGGPAAVIHSHGAYTTAASCEKDLVLVQPIDGIGKEQIGKVIIVDPDEDNPDDFLRQIVEALKQGGMRCVVVRGMGAYAVGADLDQAWANAAMLEHSMRIVLLARQANLKI